MKLSFLIMLVALMQVSAATLAQKINLKENNITLKQALKEIGRQAGYSVFYSEDLVAKVQQRVDIKAEQASLNDALNQCFEGLPLTYVINGKTILVVDRDNGPKDLAPVAVTASGIVIDENGQPMPGVNIALQGGAAKTTTGTDGRYKIVVLNSNSVLQFTFVGYQNQEVAVGNRSTVNVSMKPGLTELSTVTVNVGYQAIRKSDVTGSIASVKASEMNLTSPTVGQALVGKVAGVQVSQTGGAPYQSTKIRVRGIGSINAGSDPLYVIDGYPAGNDLFINPEDIASIDILKDAASAAIYGSRAAGGVVLITTKRGKADKGNFEYDVQVGVHEVSKKIKLMDATQWVQETVDARNNAYHDLWINAGKTWNDAMYSDDNATRVKNVGNGGIVSIQPGLYNFGTQQIITPTVNTDWQDAFYRKPIFQRHNLSYSGGSDNARYFISGGYQNQPGIAPNSGQTRINFRSNIDGRIGKNLTVSANIAFTQNNNKETQEGRFTVSPLMSALIMPPTMSPYDSNGNLLTGELTSIAGTYAYQPIENPIAVAEYTQINRKGNRSFYNATANYQIIPSLSIKANVGMQTYNEKYDYYLPTSLSSSTNLPYSAAAKAAAKATAQTSSVQDALGEFTLNYNKTFGKHTLSAIAGYTMQQTSADVITINKQGFQNDLIPEITGGGADPANLSLGATAKSTYTLLSYLARVSYNYNGKYYLTGSFRSDGSSRFGPLNKWGTFPSVAAGWNLSNESFYHDWLGRQSTVKVRVSWGLSGNNNIGNYNTLQTFATPTGVPFGTNTISTAYYPSALKDAGLGWESTSQYNGGLDLSFLNGRIAFIGNYYLSYSYNLLFNQPVSAVTGSTTVLTNLRNSKIRNSGVDFQLDGAVVDQKDVRLVLSGNISFNRNKVLNMGGANTILSNGAERPYVTHITQEGSPVGMFYGYKVLGHVTPENLGKVAPSAASANPLYVGDLYFEDVNKDGVVNDNDRQIIGTPYPKFIYGFALNAGYKKLSLRASFNGSYGNQVIDAQDYYLYNLDGTSNNYVETAYRYRNAANPGDGVSAYRANHNATQSNSTRLSTFYIQDGSFLRCTNITLDYNLTHLLKARTGITNAHLFVAVDNVFTITKYRGFNPEVDYNNGANLTPGVDYGTYPLIRAFNVGLKCAF